MVIDGREDPLIRRRDYRGQRLARPIILIEMQSIIRLRASGKVVRVVKNALCATALFIVPDTERQIRREHIRNIALWVGGDCATNYFYVSPSGVA